MTDDRVDRPGGMHVSDGSSWTPPAGGPVPPPEQPASPAGYGPSAAQSQPRFGQYGPPAPQNAPQPGGWRPPPKPGLIPLRPLGFGDLLGAAFKVVRRNPAATFGFALLATGVWSLLLFAGMGFLTWFGTDRVDAAAGDDLAAVEAGVVGMSVLFTLVPVLLSVVSTALVQGIVSMEVARGTLGEKHTLGGLWRRAKGRWGALIGWSFLIIVAVLVAFVVLTLLITAAALALGDAGWIVAVLLFLLFGAVAVVLGAWLGTKLSLVPSAIMIERLPLRAAIVRSWSLVRGAFWRTFGIQILVNVMIQIAASVVTTPISFLFPLLLPLFGQNISEPGDMVGWVIGLFAVTGVISTVFGALAAVLASSTSALIYLDRRMRTEGLDLELTRFVESGGTGDDPYQRRGPTQPLYTPAPPPSGYSG